MKSFSIFSPAEQVRRPADGDVHRCQPDANDLHAG